MSTKPFLRTISLLTVMLVIAISLAACRQPASTLVVETLATPTEGMGPFANVATQTAVSGEQGAQPTTVPNEPAGQGTAVPQTEVQPTAETPSQPVVQPTQKPAEPVKEYPKPTPGIPTTYTLQKGEYVYCIARRFNVNPAELLGLNGLGVSTVLSPGTTLKIPQTGNPFVAERSLLKHPTTYTVQAGDTVYTIACAFGDVSPDMIALVNGLKEPYTLTVGNKLNIP